jgi:hypothetical protein
MKPFISLIRWNGEAGRDARFEEDTIPADAILLAKSVIRPTANLVPATDSSVWCMLIMRDGWREGEHLPDVYAAHPFSEIRVMIDEARAFDTSGALV